MKTRTYNTDSVCLVAGIDFIWVFSVFCELSPTNVHALIVCIHVHVSVCLHAVSVLYMRLYGMHVGTFMLFTIFD